MRRRDFIKAIVGSAAATWSPAALAQQAEQVRRVGVLMHSPSNEPEAQARLTAFLQGMRDAGWEVGRNLRIEYRWSVGDRARLFADAKSFGCAEPRRNFGRCRCDLRGAATSNPCCSDCFRTRLSIRSVTDMSSAPVVNLIRLAIG